MNEQLKILVELQKLDSLILESRIKIDAMPSKISSQEAPLKNAEAAYEKARQNHAALEKKKKEKERDIEDISEKIKKIKQKTSDVKTNKEYQALLKEIEAAEREIGASEDELLNVMESLEESSKLLKAEDARIAEEKAKIDAVRKDIEMQMSIREEEVKKLKENRKNFIEKIKSDIYNNYVNLLKAHRGLAVVEAKNEICQGCNMHIPPQLFVELKTSEEIINCPQCMRILYYCPPERDAREPEAETQKAAAGENG